MSIVGNEFDTVFKSDGRSLGCGRRVVDASLATERLHEEEQANKAESAIGSSKSFTVMTSMTV